eukprot:m.93056 g.93056  ORF g.93056 m.93056 type:complete len:91 (-) comp12995_c1_seq1:6913-7185(-)
MPPATACLIVDPNNEKLEQQTKPAAVGQDPSISKPGVQSQKRRGTDARDAQAMQCGLPTTLYARKRRWRLSLWEFWLWFCTATPTRRRVF